MTQGRENRSAAAVRLPSALEQGPVARADGEGGDLHDRIRASLKNHPHYAKRHRNPLQNQPRIEFAMELPLAQRIGQGRHLTNAGDCTIELGAVQFEPGHQGSR